MLEAAGEWDAHAETFDDAPDHGLRDPTVRAAWAALLRAELPEPPADIIDLGCGTGSLSVVVAQQGHHVTGVDLAPRMIERARVKARAAAVEIGFQVADASRPPLPKASADIVLARHVLWMFPDRRAVLGRWAGLLRSGGRLVLIEGRWSTGAGMPADELVSALPRELVVSTRSLSGDTELWGGPVDDERYLVTAHIG